MIICMSRMRLYKRRRTGSPDARLARLLVDEDDEHDNRRRSQHEYAMHSLVLLAEVIRLTQLHHTLLHVQHALVHGIVNAVQDGALLYDEAVELVEHGGQLVDTFGNANDFLPACAGPCLKRVQLPDVGIRVGPAVQCVLQGHWGQRTRQRISIWAGEKEINK